LLPEIRVYGRDIEAAADNIRRHAAFADADEMPADAADTPPPPAMLLLPCASALRDIT